MSKRTAFRLLLAALILVTGALGCARDEPQIAMGVRTANDHAPFYLADKLGYYQDEGLDVAVHLVPSNTEIIEAVQRGDLQAGAVPITTAIAAISAGVQIKIVAMTGRAGDGLLVRSDSGIETLADLRGRRVATIRGSILDVPLRVALQDAGLDPERDVTMIYFTKLGDMIQALETGQVDAASNTEPFMTQVERDGWGEILCYYSASWPDHPCCVVFVSESLRSERPDDVVALMRGHLRAVAYAQDHPHETAEAIVEYLEAFDVPLVEASLDEHKMRIDAEITPQEVECMAGLMHEFGLIERLPRADELLDTSLLRRAQP